MNADLITLRSDGADVVIAPDLGASVLAFTLSDGTPVFRPAPLETQDPFAGCFLMAPWCNRIANGIVDCAGEFHRIAPTHRDHPLPIHGSAASMRWAVLEETGASVRLGMQDAGPAPFLYDAELSYTLRDQTFSISLMVTHKGAAPLPYGLGVHPWFPRNDRVRIKARADQIQTVGPDMLPTGSKGIEHASGHDFSLPAPLPSAAIDTAFAGWNGTALLELSRDWQVALRTNPALGHYQIYSPGRASGFFCFEPVSHPIDAHNAPGHPGLWVLEPGATAQMHVTFDAVRAQRGAGPSPAEIGTEQEI